jgi:hypothetical protein
MTKYSADSGNQTTPLNLAECCRQASGDAQDESQVVAKLNH